MIDANAVVFLESAGLVIPKREQARIVAGRAERIAFSSRRDRSAKIVPLAASAIASSSAAIGEAMPPSPS